MKPPFLMNGSLARQRLTSKLQISIISKARLLSTTPPKLANNRIFDPVRSPSDFDTLNLLAASNRTALITLWTASWCPSCRVLVPLVRQLVEEGVGEEQGGVGYAEIEFDSPNLGDVAGRYMITSIPTLLAFSRQEAQLQSKLTNVEEMKDKDFLRLWMEDEAMRGGSGGKGGGLFGGLFGVK
ncbi:hypothetical protein BDR22DRAFT_586348 [Usnea florida]